MIRNYDVEDVTFEQVRYAYLDCRKNKRTSYNQVEFERNLEFNLVKLYKELKNRTWEPGKSITFIVTRPKPREVFAACFEDRIVHHLLIRQIEHLFEAEFIEDNYNCRVGKGVLYGVNCLAEKIEDMSHFYCKTMYVARFDISGFFMSINKRILCKRVVSFLEERYKGKNLDFLLWITRSIILHCPEQNCEYRGDPELKKLISPDKSLFTTGINKGLPIGNLTSQIFANFYLNEFDKIASKEFNGGYGRYVDDFYVISSNKRKIRAFRKFAKFYLMDQLEVKLHEDKYYIQDIMKGVKFIGYVVKPGRIYIGNKTVSNFYTLVRELNHQLKSWSESKILKNLKHIESRWNSYIGFMIHTKSYKIRRKAWDELLDKGWRKYFKRDKRMMIKRRNRYR